MKNKYLFPIIALIIIIVTSISALSVADTTAMNNNATLYFSFDADNLSGSNPLDLTSYNNDGSSFSLDVNQTGILNESFGIRGALGSYVSISSDASLSPVNYLSWNIWINPDTFSDYDNIFNRHGEGATSGSWGSDVYGYALRMNTGASKLFDAGIVLSNGADTRVSTTSTMGAGNWHMITFVYNGTNLKIYVNGTLDNTQAGTGTIVYAGADNDMRIGNANSVNYHYDGLVDEFVVFNDYVLTQDDITFLWASGSPSSDEQYEFSVGAGSLPYHTINVADVYNDSALSGVNVSLACGKSNLTNALGTANIYNCTGTQAVTLSKATYTPVTSYNVNENSSVNTEMYQYKFNLNPENIVNGSSVTDFNISVGSKTYVNGTNVYLKSGVNNLIFGKNSYYNNSFNINTSSDTSPFSFDVHNSKLNITAVNYRTGAPINTFTIDLYEIVNAYSNTTSTTNGTTNFLIDQSLKYLLNFSATGYAYGYHNITNASFSEAYEFNVYASNSILITIYDQQTGLLINSTNTTINFNQGATSFENVTTNGTFFISNLTAGTWTLTFSNDNYTNTAYYVSVGNNTFQTLDAYLLPSDSNLVVFTTYDKSTGSTLEGATFTLSTTINGTPTIVSSKETDITGRVQFPFEDDTEYFFNIIASGYVSKNFTLNPIIFNSYNVWLDRETEYVDVSAYSNTFITFTPHEFFNNNSVNITFEFSNGAGELSYYGFNATFNGVDYVGSTDTNAYGSIILDQLNISNATYGDQVIINYWYYKTNEPKAYYFTKIYPVVINVSGSTLESNKGELFGLGLVQRALIVFLIVVSGVAVASYFQGDIAGVIMGMFIYGIFAWTEFIPKWSIYLNLIVGFVYLIWRGTK